MVQVRAATDAQGFLETRQTYPRAAISGRDALRACWLVAYGVCRGVCPFVDGWWLQVLNLEDTLCVTQNAAEPVNMPSVWCVVELRCTLSHAVAQESSCQR